jgi:hypothetical protein
MSKTPSKIPMSPIASEVSKTKTKQMDGVVTKRMNDEIELCYYENTQHPLYRHNLKFEKGCLFHDEFQER